MRLSKKVYNSLHIFLIWLSLETYQILFPCLDWFYSTKYIASQKNLKHLVFRTATNCHYFFNAELPPELCRSYLLKTKLVFIADIFCLVCFRLSLTLAEIVHIRTVLTKAEVEALPTEGKVRHDVESRKVCFLCLKTR